MLPRVLLIWLMLQASPSLSALREPDPECAQDLAEQGEEARQSEKTPPIALARLQKELDLADLSQDQVSEVINEAAMALGGMAHVSASPAKLYQRFRAHGATDTVTFSSLLKAWARKQWEKENPGAESLTNRNLTKPERGGKYLAEWIGQWKRSRGVVKSLPAGTIVLSGLAQDVALADLTAEVLSDLLYEAAEGLGGVGEMNSSIRVLNWPLAAKESKDSFLVITLLRTWAIKQWQKENPGLPPLATRQILVPKEGGKSLATWIDQWKESRGHPRELPAGTLVLPGLEKEVALSSLSASELSRLLRAAADQMGGFETLNTGMRFSRRSFAAEDSKEWFCFQNLLLHWASKQWSLENPGRPPLNSKDLFKPEAGGKTYLTWLRQWQATQRNP